MSDMPLPSARNDSALWLRGVFLAALVVLVAAAAMALARDRQARPTGSADDPNLPLDQRMILIADKLQCPICEGQSVAYSNSQLAGEMRRIIEDKLRAGETEAEIITYFVDRYGVKILREPPRRGLLAWLWITPVAGFAIALIGLVWALRNMAARRAREDQPPTPEEASDGILDPELQNLIAQYDKDLLQ